MSVFIDGSSNDRDSLAVAVKFCRQMGGRLDVVYAGGQRAYVVLDSVAIPDADEAGAATAKQAFDEVCSGLDFVRWAPSEEKPEDVIRGHGMLDDVLILERVHGEEGPDVLALNIALFETPAPVLVCPPLVPETVGKSVAVVWNSSLQAARAVRSAMPIIEKADRVTVLTDSSNRDADPAPLLDYLAGYGITPQTATFDGDTMTARGRGRAILAATQGDADLLVMGAYGENMLSNLMGLGRTTQKVCTATKIPTLIHS